MIHRPNIRFSHNQQQLQKIPTFLKTSLIQRNRNSQQYQLRSSINTLVQRSNPLSLKCQICGVYPSRSDMSALSEVCQHLFCKSCLEQFVVYKINVMEEVNCPQEECGEKMQQSCFIYLNLPDNCKQKYQRYLLWKQTLDNPNLKLCPSETCRNGVINLNQDILKCSKCRKEYCRECMMQLHEGACDTNFQQQFSDWKRCPKCNMFIEKIEGCNHMTCRCMHQFCFVCLSNWDDEHYSCGDGEGYGYNAEHVNYLQVLDQYEIQEAGKPTKIAIIFLMILLFLPLMAVIIAINLLAFAILILIGSLVIVIQGLQQYCCCTIALFVFLGALLPIAIFIGMGFVGVVFAIAVEVNQILPFICQLIRDYFSRIGDICSSL